MSQVQERRMVESETWRRKEWLQVFLGEHMDDIELAHPVVVPDPDGCGVGRGDGSCCALLTCGADGFVCERYGPLEGHLTFRAKEGEMNARRIPEPGVGYPECMVHKATAS